MSATLISTFTDIGDAIRAKDKTTQPIPVADMPQRILDIEAGGIINIPDLPIGSAIPIARTEDFIFFHELTNK